MIWVEHQLIAEKENSQTILECRSEAFPKSINYWTKGDGQIITQGMFNLNGEHGFQIRTHNKPKISLSRRRFPGNSTRH